MRSGLETLAFFGALFCSLAGFAPAQQPGDQAPANLPPPPQTILVQEFAYDVAPQSDQSMERLPGRVGGRVHDTLNPPEDPVAHAQKVCIILADSITAAMQKAGIDAVHLSPGQPPPAAGWLVGGEFMTMDEGNRLKRAVIGFKSGADEVLVQVHLYDLGQNATEPFLSYGAGKSSGFKAGAILSMNPYVLAAKYVMSKKTPEKDVKKLGQTIAQDVLKLCQSATQQHAAPKP